MTDNEWKALTSDQKLDWLRQAVEGLTAKVSGPVIDSLMQHEAGISELLKRLESLKVR